MVGINSEIYIILKRTIYIRSHKLGILRPGEKLENSEFLEMGKTRKLRILGKPENSEFLEMGVSKRVKSHPFAGTTNMDMAKNTYFYTTNRYMGNRYDASEPTKYITYLDANNLYGWAMSKPLPTHGFKWMEPNELENWRNYLFILKVDFEYPRSLHDLHNNYPLAPEQMKINKVKKLISNLGDKEKYVPH